MLVPILQYPDRVTSGRDVYRVSAVGERQDDGRWSGYLVFTSIIGGRSVMTPRETTQSSFETLDHWARGISPVYLEGAIERALSLQPEARLERQLADIERLEVDATLEAEELERAAAIARAEAELAAEKRVETQRALERRLEQKRPRLRRMSRWQRQPKPKRRRREPAWRPPAHPQRPAGGASNCVVPRVTSGDVDATWRSTRPSTWTARGGAYG
jgi:hypothetical protein